MFDTNRLETRILNQELQLYMGGCWNKCIYNCKLQFKASIYFEYLHVALTLEIDFRELGRQNYSWAKTCNTSLNAPRLVVLGHFGSPPKDTGYNVIGFLEKNLYQLNTNLRVKKTVLSLLYVPEIVQSLSTDSATAQFLLSSCSALTQHLLSIPSALVQNSLSTRTALAQ